MSYRVVKTIREVGHTEIIHSEKFLVAIDYNPYQKPREYLDTYFSEDPEEAFTFETQAAAEIAAVFVGGRVDVRRLSK